MASTVTVSDIVAGLRRVGVAEGDVLLVHASLSRFGHVTGGADALIDALIEAVGPAGTVAMPGFTFQLNELPDPVFDVRRTPVWTSKVYEAFRQRPCTHRSHHASHSVVALGAAARELTSEHGPYPCLRPSPFGKLVDLGGKIILAGVDHNSNTTFHLIEETAELPYVGYEPAPGAVIIDEAGGRHPLPTMRHQMSKVYDFNRMDKLLWTEGIQTESYIGDAVVRCLDARAMVDFTLDLLEIDPRALLERNGGRLEVVVGR